MSLKEINRNKDNLWVARDKDGSLFLFTTKPKKHSKDNYWFVDSSLYLLKESLQLPTDMFPQVKWEDEVPTKVIIVESE